MNFYSNHLFVASFENILVVIQMSSCFQLKAFHFYFEKICVIFEVLLWIKI